MLGSNWICQIGVNCIDDVFQVVSELDKSFAVETFMYVNSNIRVFICGNIFSDKDNEVRRAL